MKKKSSVWDKLPTDVWGVVIQYFPVETLASFSLTSKYFNETVTSTCNRMFSIEKSNGKKADVELFCFNDKYYLTLCENNFSEHKFPKRLANDPKLKDNKDLTTRWYKIQVDPKTWRVHTGDITFAKSKGKLSYNGNTTFQGWASCGGCEEPNNTSASARADLRDTPFAFGCEFEGRGYLPGSSCKFSNKKQTVDLTGGGLSFIISPYCVGYCGGTFPKEMRGWKYGYDIKLVPL